MSNPEHYYRFRDVALYDEYGNRTVKIYLEAFIVIRRTPCGAWIGWNLNDDKRHHRFVLDNARRRFAYPTQELALRSFLMRKRWQQHHLRRQLGQSEDAQDAAAKLVLPIEDQREFNLS